MCINKLKELSCVIVICVIFLVKAAAVASGTSSLQALSLVEDEANWSARAELLSIFGWDGDRHAALAVPNAFLIRDREQDLCVEFGIFNDSSSYKWYNHSGYLPCLVTEFQRDDCTVKIMNFGDKVTFGGNDFVIAYSRVSVHNHGSEIRKLAPDASPEFIPLNSPDEMIAPGQTKNFDFAIGLDRFGRDYPWPSAEQIKSAGSWDEHFSHMKGYWDEKLSEIAQIKTPDKDVENFYKATFIYVHIIKDFGHQPFGGEGAYDRIYDHDVTGRMADYMTFGYFSESEELFKWLPMGFQYDDATWKYSWPWSLYLLKTDDVKLVRKYWDKIKQSAHKIADDRTGPQGTMKKTPDIDSLGYWTIDNWSALFGLRCYEYVCQRLGELEEAAWAESQYNDFLESLNSALSKTIQEHKLDYIPVSLIQPNDDNRCKDPVDACWSAHLWFGRWAWEGWLAGAVQYGPNLDLIDATYDYGFGRLKEAGIPAHTTGWYPPNIGHAPAISNVYNACNASAGLRGKKYRTEPIKAFRFLIDNCQSGPYSFWETIEEIVPQAWEGTHPKGGHGCSPHPWGQSSTTKLLLEAIIAEFYDGKVLVGRGIPNDWLRSREIIEATNVPISHNKRMGVRVQAISDRQVKLDLLGDSPANVVLFSLPIFDNNIEKVTAGTVDQIQDWVILNPSVRSVTVTLKNEINKD